MSEHLQDLLALCSEIIQNGHYNACIIEHMAVILSYSVHLLQAPTLRVFTQILDTDYRYHCLTFLLELLEGSQFVGTLVKEAADYSEAKKGDDSNYEFSHKLLTSSMSAITKELFQIVSDDSLFSRDFQRNDEAIETMQSDYDRLLAGAIYLVGVILVLPLIMHHIISQY